MTIDAPELQSEVKTFLKEPSSTYSETLKSIHLDYRAQTTGEEMRRKYCSSSVLDPSLRHTKVEFNVEKKTDYFSPNVCKLLPLA